jgi:lactam utilization protein B
MYQPSRGELLKWYEVADAAQDMEAKELVLATGKQLAAEFQATGEGQVPPRDYSHASVVVSEGVREQMERMVEELVIVVTPDIVVTPTMVVTPTIVVKTDKSQEFDR